MSDEAYLLSYNQDEGNKEQWRCNEDRVIPLNLKRHSFISTFVLVSRIDPVKL